MKFTPLQALNKSYLKLKPHWEEFENFKTALTKLLNNINENEREDHNKTLVRDFLITTFYTNNFVNSKGDTDLVIHLGKKLKAKLVL